MLIYARSNFCHFVGASIETLKGGKRISTTLTCIANKTTELDPAYVCEHSSREVDVISPHSTSDLKVKEVADRLAEFMAKHERTYDDTKHGRQYEDTTHHMSLFLSLSISISQGSFSHIY